MTFTNRKVFFFLCLLLVFQGRCGYAQQQPPAQQPAEAQKQQPAEAQKQQPAEAQQAKPAAPAAEKKTAETKPAKPKRTRPAGEPDTGDGIYSVSLFYWLNPGHPIMRTGRSAAAGIVSDLNFPGHNQPTPAVMASIPTGDDNTLRISYFRATGSRDTVAPVALNIFDVAYDAGDYLSTKYVLQNVKVSWDYLSWPFPQESSSWRFKTFWEVQYTNIHSTIDAPLKLISLDSSGNAISNTGDRVNWLVYPTFGAGIEKFVSQHFRVEVKASGFAVPHFATTWDADVFAAYRLGRVEIQLGGRAFHFKTSPRRSEYISDTLPGAYVSLRWYAKH